MLRGWDAGLRIERIAKVRMVPINQLVSEKFDSILILYRSTSKDSICPFC